MRNYKEMKQVLELLQFSDENNTSLSGNKVMLLRDKGMLLRNKGMLLPAGSYAESRKCGKRTLSVVRSTADRHYLV